MTHYLYHHFSLFPRGSKDINEFSLASRGCAHLVIQLLFILCQLPSFPVIYPLACRNALGMRTAIFSLTRLQRLQIKRRRWRWRWRWRWWWRMLRFSPEISSRSVDTPGAGAGAASSHLSSKLSSLSGRGRQNVLVSLFFSSSFYVFSSK